MMSQRSGAFRDEYGRPWGDDAQGLGPEDDGQSNVQIESTSRVADDEIPEVRVATQPIRLQRD
jgi:hypothetical protein